MDIEGEIKKVIEYTISKKHKIAITRPELKDILILYCNRRSLMYSHVAKDYLPTFERYGIDLNYWVYDFKSNLVKFNKDNEFVQLELEKAKK